MRPIQLELTNFGPYRKEVINFTNFDSAPLFLIGVILEQVRVHFLML